MDQQTINIPVEYKRLFDNDWREAAVYGGRYCFSKGTIISLEYNKFKNIEDVLVGDRVLSMEGVYDKIISIDKFRSDYDPKPMLSIKINGRITKTTYDHKYFDGKTYVPIYQLVWRIMDESQRRTLKLLCKQYGENTNNELQGWLQNKGNETSTKSQRIFNDRSKWKNKIDSQNNYQDIYSKYKQQGHSESQEWYKNGQPCREFRMGNEKRAINTSVETWIEKGKHYYWGKFQENDRGASKRIIKISLGTRNYANKNDVKIFINKDWPELRWDKGFIEWENLEVSSKGISTQKNDCLGSKKIRIEVVGVHESEDVWSISTEKYHNYFANGINVSNSLKSHTVARYLLIRARQKKTRIGCFREFQNSIAESSYQLLADLIKQYELNDFILTNNSIVNKINGSDFLFKGLWNNEQSIKSIEGIDIAWVEEAQTVSEKSLEVLTPTIRKDGSQIIYTYNRLLEEDPVHNRLVIQGRPNTLIINVNYDIALKYGMMPEVIRLEMEDDKEKRPALYKHKWLGEPYNQERKIYRDWEVVDSIPHEARLERYGLDFGYSNDPTAIVAIYRYNGGFILDEVTYQKGLSNKQISDILLNQPQALIVADSAEPKSIDEIMSYGCMIQPAQKGQGSVLQGIQYVQDQRISITKRSLNGIKEYRNYMWQTDKEGKIINVPEPGWDHFTDALRYGMESLKPTEDEPVVFPDDTRLFNEGFY